jgi:hypothetical protein
MTLHSLGRHRDELRAAERGLLKYPGNTAVFAAKMRALAALGRVAEVESSLARMPVPEWGPAAWTPGTVLAMSAQELDAHGQPEAAGRVRVRLQTWYRSLPPERTAT